MRRQKMTWSAAAIVTAAAAVAVGGTVVAQAGTGAAHRHLTAQPTCPSATICAFTGPNETGTQANFPTSANHSQWIDFDSVVGFHPDSIINNSGSDIWVYDEQNADSGSSIAGPYCAFGTSLGSGYTFTDWLQTNGGKSNQGYSSQSYQPGFFFIQYNVNTCGTQPPAPPA
jgi:hypothetical protein